MITNRQLTKYVVIGTVAGLIGYDLYAALSPEENDTISEFIADAAVERPIVAVAAGVLIGHFFWAVRSTTKENK